MDGFCANLLPPMILQTSNQNQNPTIICQNLTVMTNKTSFASSSLIPKNSQRIPKVFQKNSQKIPKEFPKNFQTIPKEFPNNSQDFENIQIPIPTLHLEAENPFGLVIRNILSHCEMEISRFWSSSMIDRTSKVFYATIEKREFIRPRNFFDKGSFTNYVDKTR